MLDKAKDLRSRQTEAEQRLWYHLRAHRFMGLKFKRQKPMGRFIVDFVCLEQKLVVEVDGGQHAERVEYDARRDAWLRGQGFVVLRFWNHEVMQEMDGVLERIRLTVLQSVSLAEDIALTAQSTLSPDPSPTGGRGEWEAGPPSRLRERD